MRLLALLLSFVMLLLALLPIDVNAVCLARGSLLPRLWYHFFHVSFLHAAVNVWCFLQLVFLYKISSRKLLTAYIVATVVPTFCLSQSSVVGFSGICFALMGMETFHIRRKGRYLCTVLAFLLLGFLFPSVAAAVHVFCFVTGAAIAFINTPLSCLRKVT